MIRKNNPVRILCHLKSNCYICYVFTLTIVGIWFMKLVHMVSVAFIRWLICLQILCAHSFLTHCPPLCKDWCFYCLIFLLTIAVLMYHWIKVELTNLSPFLRNKCINSHWKDKTTFRERCSIWRDYCHISALYLVFICHSKWKTLFFFSFCLNFCYVFIIYVDFSGKK